MESCSQAEFSRMHGVSKKTVTLWKQRGWLVMVGDRVDIFKSNAILKKYRPDGIGQQVTGNTPRKPKVTGNGNTQHPAGMKSPRRLPHKPRQRWLDMENHHE